MIAKLKAREQRQEEHLDVVNDWLYGEGMYTGSVDTNLKSDLYNEILKRTMRAHYYQTGAEYVEGQFPIIKALDFADEVVY